MTRAAILGLGPVFAGGAGVDALRTALAAPPPEPSRIPCDPANPEVRVPVFTTRPPPPETPADAALLRRMDPFVQRSLQAARLALQDAGDAAGTPERTGLVVATGFGPTATTFGFLDQLMDKGDNRGSPVLFAASLHNAPAAALTQVLGWRGPSLTLAGFSQPFARALAAAIDRLERRAADWMLVLAADEFHPIVGYGLLGLGRCPPDGRLRPLEFDRWSWVPGETFAAFLLGREGEAPARHGVLESPVAFRGALPPGTLDAAAPLFLAARGDADEGSAYAAALPNDLAIAAPSDRWGSSPTSDALVLAAAALGSGVWLSFDRGGLGMTTRLRAAGSSA